ncbi:MAG: hypothetical protein K1X88_28680 [Nannocystaceae bacterium]|nr:hypothetical protein [Nannocystaceae bacterium]
MNTKTMQQIDDADLERTVGGLTFSDDGSGYVYADNGDVWYQTDSNVFVNNNTGETICGGLSCFA